MKKLFVFFLLLFLHFNLFCQQKTDTTTLKNKPFLKSYWQFLQPDSIHQENSFATVSYGLMFSLPGKVSNGGRGFIFSAGLNLARLFSKKIVLGITFDLKGLPGAWSNGYTANFISDFNNAYQNNLTNQADSAKAGVLKESLNDSSRYGHGGNSCGTFGIMFSPFPKKYGGFMLKVKEGFYGFPIGGVYGNKYFNNQLDSPDHVDVDVPITLSVELGFKPFLFFPNAVRKHFWLYFIKCSCYYERLSWKNADMDGLPFSSFLTSSFINKYAIDTHIGFRLVAAIY